MWKSAPFPCLPASLKLCFYTSVPIVLIVLMYYCHRLNIPPSFCSSPSWLFLCSIFLCSSLTFPSTLPSLALPVCPSQFSNFTHPPPPTHCVNPLLSTPSNNSRIRPSCSVTMDICSRLTSHAPLSVAFSLIFFFFFFWHRPLSSLSFFLFFSLSLLFVYPLSLLWRAATSV